MLNPPLERFNFPAYINRYIPLKGMVSNCTRSERIQVGVLDLKEESDPFPCQLSGGTSVFPGYRVNTQLIPLRLGPLGFFLKDSCVLYYGIAV